MHKVTLNAPRLLNRVFPNSQAGFFFQKCIFVTTSCSCLKFNFSCLKYMFECLENLTWRKWSIHTALLLSLTSKLLAKRAYIFFKILTAISTILNPALLILYAESIFSIFGISRQIWNLKACFGHSEKIATMLT